MKSARISISHIISLITPLQTARFTAASHLRLGVHQLVVGEPGVGRPEAVGGDDITGGRRPEAVGGDNVITGGRLEAAGGYYRLAVAGRLCPRRARLAARLAGPGVTLGWLRTLRIRSDGVRWSITVTISVVVVVVVVPISVRGSGHADPHPWVLVRHGGLHAQGRRLRGLKIYTLRTKRSKGIRY